jgi:hypothetical protein
MSDDRLDRVINSIQSLRDVLAARNVRLIVLTNQMKSKFYPEFFPSYAAKLIDKSRFDDVRERLKSIPGMVYLDTTPHLLFLRGARPIFYETDIHWNDPAAFDAATTVVGTIGLMEGRAKPIWSHKLDLGYLPNFGGFESSAVPLLITPPPREYALFVRPNWLPVKETVTPSPVSPACPFEAITIGPDSPVELLPTTVMYGDSFADGLLRSGMNSYFKEFLRTRWGHSTLEDTLVRMPQTTKYFIFQFIESHFLSFEDLKLPTQDKLMTRVPCEVETRAAKPPQPN